MNFKGEPKTLRNIKSRFKQFKRYIDQGDKYKIRKTKKNPHMHVQNFIFIAENGFTDYTVVAA